jgi:hypothetical protein
MNGNSMARGPGGGPSQLSADMLAAISGPSVDEIMSRLSLGDDQVDPVKSILDAAQEERADILPGPGERRQPDAGTSAASDVLDRCADLDERVVGMLQPILSEQQLAVLVSVLTQAQKAREGALTELVKQAKPPEGGPRGGRPPGGPGGGGFPTG